MVEPYGRFPHCPRVYFTSGAHPLVCTKLLDFGAIFAQPLTVEVAQAYRSGFGNETIKTLNMKPSKPIVSNTENAGKSFTKAVSTVGRALKMEVCSGHGDWVVQHAENQADFVDWV